MNLKKASGYLLCSLFFFSCIHEKKSTTIYTEQSLDNIKTVPDWLIMNVEEAFPSDDLNIWIPTNNFQTSALIRVPRFPRKFKQIEIKNNEALKDFEIISLAPNKTLHLTAVRNEQISAQIALGSKNNLTNLSVKLSDFINSEGFLISNENIQTRFVKYVPVQRARSEYVWSPKIEEIIGEGVSGTLNPNVVGDPLIEAESVNVPKFRAQPIWLTFKIPKTTNPGTYEGNVTINCKEYPKISYKIKLQVLEHSLPDVKDYKFHLDLWLNPSSIAEYYNLEHWSDEHWKMISVYLKDYASRGGKNITTTITEEPWHKPWIKKTTVSQSFFGYKSMVLWTMNEKGKWEFDYSIFDKYVQMATDFGISQSINAYSLTPFHTHQKIHYFDEKDNKNKILELKIDEVLYEEIWSEFLIDFKNHLIKKNLFERTYLGFDEKPDKVLTNLVKIIKKTVPEFLDRIVIAGHPEATRYAQNLSISYMFFPGQPLEKLAIVPVLPTIEKRNKDNKITTFYLCAEPSHPNSLTYSPAVESQMIPWLALKYNTDGYLRWAYNNWTRKPYSETVFIHNQGDDYYVYPGDKGPVSSIRWELLKEGIEDYELLSLVKENGNISNDSLNKAIEFATRNQDGRYKKSSDIIMARKIILEK